MRDPHATNSLELKRLQIGDFQDVGQVRAGARGDTPAQSAYPLVSSNMAGWKIPFNGGL